MTNTNANTIEQAGADALATMPTKLLDFTFHFKSFTQEEKGYERLAELVEKEAIATADIEQITEEGKADKFKRKSVTINMEVPVVAVEGFSAAQNDHLQQLVNKAIKGAQDDVVGAGTPTAETLFTWDKVLESPYAQRTAAVKVTAEMVKAVVDIVKATMPALFNEKVAAAVAQLGEKRFSLASCQPVSNAVLEKLQGAVATWYSELAKEDAEVAAQCEPVVNLWATNLEKVLKPSEEFDLDMFA